MSENIGEIIKELSISKGIRDPPQGEEPKNNPWHDTIYRYEVASTALIIDHVETCDGIILNRAMLGQNHVYYDQNDGDGSPTRVRIHIVGEWEDILKKNKIL